MKQSDQNQKALRTYIPDELVPTLHSLLHQQSSDASFVDLYFNRLIAATQKKVTHKGGEITLPRWTIEHLGGIQSISYSYHPSEVATALKQLLDLITIAEQGNIRKLRFSRDMLYGFSGVLGYYNLCNFFLNTIYGKMDKYWLPKLLDLSTSYAVELESPIGSVSSWLKEKVHTLIYDVGLEGAPCYFYPYDRLDALQHSLQYANIIIDSEKRRLVGHLPCPHRNVRS